MLRATISSTGAAADIIAAPGAGKALRVFMVQWAMDGTGTLTIHEGTAGAATRIVYADCVAGSNGVLDLTYLGGLRITVNTALRVTTSAQNAKGVVFYTVDG